MELNSNLLKEVSLITKSPIKNELVEISLYEKEQKISSYGNVYDYNYIKIIGEFTLDNSSFKIPAFWFQDYNISFVSDEGNQELDGIETVEKQGIPHFRFRFLPVLSGNWNLKIEVFLNDEFVEMFDYSFVVNENTNEYKGFIRIDQSNNRFFVYENLETFYPVGQNTSWYSSKTRKSRDYDIWFSKMAVNQMNTARIWLAPWGFALHWHSYNNYDERYDALGRLDRVINLAHNYRIYFLLTLLNHGQFCTIVNPVWDKNPWNKSNGGILDKPTDFFNSEEAKRIYKNQIIYLIARYSYSHYVMAWELFNEVDHIDDYDIYKEDITLWHKEMSEFIKANDPYQHLVTTSYKFEEGDAYYLNSIDFANPHNYSYFNLQIINKLPKVLDNLYNKYQKPIFHSEFGIEYRSGNLTYQQDPTGVAIKQSLWATILGGGAGGAMNWWWDSYVHKYNLYHLFKAPALYAKAMDLRGAYKPLKKIAKLNNKAINVIGYCFDNRVYGYLYNRKWFYNSKKEIPIENDLTITFPFNNGKYSLMIINTDTFQCETKEIEVNNNIITFTFLSITTDIAFYLIK